MTTYERGRAEGQRALLARQLERCFGPLTAAVKERLSAWPTERLADLGEAIVTGQSLRELGLENAVENERSL